MINPVCKCVAGGHSVPPTANPKDSATSRVEGSKFPRGRLSLCGKFTSVDNKQSGEPHAAYNAADQMRDVHELAFERPLCRQVRRDT